MGKNFKFNEKDEKIEEEKEHIIQGLEPETVKSGAESFFDGGLLGFIGWGILAWLLMVVTLGLGTPWAICMLYRYQFKHTAYNGHRLKFEGSGIGLLGNIIKWTFFTIITLGIYGLFVPVREAKWIISKLHYEDEEYVKGDSYFEGTTLQLIGLNILTFIICVLSLGILYPFTVCMKLRWINKHTVINKKKLEFTGSAISLWGKYILWTILSIITLGIFALWVPILELKWQTKNTHIKTVIDKEYKKDNSIWLVIPILVITTTIIGFGIYKLTQIDYNDISIKLKAMNVAAVVADKIDKDFGSSSIKWDMCRELKKSYDNDEISYKEYEEYMDKYDLYNIRDPYDKYTIDGPVAGINPGEKVDCIYVAGYKVSYGTYTGKDALYDIEKQQEIPVDIKVVVDEDGITVDGKKQKYSIRGDKILINDIEIIHVMGNNELVYLAQSCPTLEYQGK